MRVALARIQIARLPDDESLEGMNLSEILQKRGAPITVASGAELIADLIGRGARAIYHTIDDREGGDVERVMQYPHASVASDGSVFEFGEGHPHPRSYGTFPRVLARYVREKELIPWEQAIHKMTACPQVVSAGATAAWSNRATPPTSSSLTPKPSPTSPTSKRPTATPRRRSRDRGRPLCAQGRQADRRASGAVDSTVALTIESCAPPQPSTVY